MAGQTKTVIVGSVALDSVRTVGADKTDLLGGSASYACIAASFFGGVGMVGVVGDDFPEKYAAAYRRAGVDLAGLQRVPGKTFRWAGEYEADMNSRRTISTDLNVFADFKPELPPAYRRAGYVFLANIGPELQLHVLSQARGPRFVVADTMDLWIRTARKPLEEVMANVDMVLLNDSEARLFTGESNTVVAARRVLSYGPEWVVVKKGEHGAILFSRKLVFIVPARPVEKVKDSTGAGDTFAGGFIGALAESGGIGFREIRRALMYGAVMASHCIEDFSIGGLVRLNRRAINARLADLRRMSAMRR